LDICPWIHGVAPEAIDWFWRDDFRLEYVFIANLLASGIKMLCLLPELGGFRFRFDGALAKQMIRYCFPLMLMGLAGMCNQVVDKLIFPALYPDHDNWSTEIGTYNACFKIAMIMMMFTQAFRYAYEPFVFEKSKEKNAAQSYADIMKYFLIFGWFVFLGVLFYLDIIKYFISPRYFGALDIVPIVLVGELCFAVYFNLSIWYKLADKTQWGALFSVIGFAVIVLINILFIPQYSYRACAWAILAGNGLMMLLSGLIGRRHYPSRYDWRAIAFYSFLALALYFLSRWWWLGEMWMRLVFNTLLLAIYGVVFWVREWKKGGLVFR
jgi:O-antigen/teichoic acid export membrane protein